MIYVDFAQLYSGEILLYTIYMQHKSSKQDTMTLLTAHVGKMMEL